MDHSHQMNSVSSWCELVSACIDRIRSCKSSVTFSLLTAVKLGLVRLAAVLVCPAVEYPKLHQKFSIQGILLNEGFSFMLPFQELSYKTIFLRQIVI